MIAASFFERVRQELLKIYEGLDTEDEIRQLKRECADWKRLAEEREDAHTQGYREGRGVANLRLDELKGELEAWKASFEALNRCHRDDMEAQRAAIKTAAELRAKLDAVSKLMDSQWCECPEGSAPIQVYCLICTIKEALK